jgi:hypothetical protein
MKRKEKKNEIVKEKEMVLYSIERFPSFYCPFQTISYKIIIQQKTQILLVTWQTYIFFLVSNNM